MQTCPYNPGDYIDTAIAAKLVARSQETIRLWCTEGRFRAFPLGGKWMIERGSFFLWLQDQMSEMTQSPPVPAKPRKAQ